MKTLVALLLLSLSIAGCSTGVEIDSKPTVGYCEYATDWEDDQGQIWSVSDIETNDGCEDAILIAIQDGKRNTGLEAYMPPGWDCDGGGLCRNGRKFVRYSLSFIGS